ncbi:MAG: prepilin-type N-terminal cleavage/methylation domain-containing protein [Planctomycetota bacterium]
MNRICFAGDRCFAGKRRQRGFTLTELVIVFIVGGTMMSVAVGLIHVSFRLGSQQNRREHDSRTLDRLAESVRQDRRSMTRTIKISDRLWHFERRAGTVRYTIQDGAVRRIASTRDDQATLENQVADERHEAFLLSDFYVPTFRLHSRHGDPAAATQTWVMALDRRPQRDQDAIAFRAFEIGAFEIGGVQP